MDEKRFLDEPGVFVSSARVEIQGKTYATRNIGSVALSRLSAGIISILLAAVGVIFAVGGILQDENGWTAFGLCMAAIFGAEAYKRSNRWRVIIVSGGSELVAYETSDRVFADEIRGAISRAISVR